MTHGFFIESYSESAWKPVVYKKLQVIYTGGHPLVGSHFLFGIMCPVLGPVVLLMKPRLDLNTS